MHIAKLKDTQKIFRQGLLYPKTTNFCNENSNSFKSCIYMSLTAKEALKNSMTTPPLMKTDNEDRDVLFIFRPELLDMISFSQITNAHIQGEFVARPIFYRDGKVNTISNFKTEKIVEAITDIDYSNEIIFQDTPIPIFGLLESIFFPATFCSRSLEILTR